MTRPWWNRHWVRITFCGGILLQIGACTGADWTFLLVDTTADAFTATLVASAAGALFNALFGQS
jgi:hypothetical protein